MISHRKKILNAFESMEELALKDEQLFVHGHVLAPHQPFVFDSLGNAIEPDHYYTIWKPVEDGRDPVRYKEEYISQMKFVNTKILQLVDKILANENRESIIIIQGDHGPGSELTNTKSIEGNNFKERLTILNAYYFPDKDYNSLYDSISPVNSFRVIFNKYFETDFPLLEDEAFYSTWDRPYKFVNVTEQVR